MNRLATVASPMDAAEATHGTSPGHALKPTCYACSTTPEGACPAAQSPTQVFSTTPEGARPAAQSPTQVFSTELDSQEPAADVEDVLGTGAVTDGVQNSAEYENKEAEIAQDCQELEDDSPEKSKLRPSVASPHCPPPARPVRRSMCEHHSSEGEVQAEVHVLSRPCKESEEHEVEEDTTVPRPHVSTPDVKASCKDSTIKEDQLLDAYSAPTAMQKRLMRAGFIVQPQVEEDDELF